MDSVLRLSRPFFRKWNWFEQWWTRFREEIYLSWISLTIYLNRDLQFAHVNDKQPILPVWSKTWGCSHTQAAADHRFMSWVRVVSVLLKTDNQSLKAKTSRTLDFRSLYSRRRQKTLVKVQFIIKIAASVSLLTSMVNASLHGQWFFWTVKKNIWSKEWALRKWNFKVFWFLAEP